MVLEPLVRISLSSSIGIDDDDIVEEVDASTLEHDIKPKVHKSKRVSNNARESNASHQSVPKKLGKRLISDPPHYTDSEDDKEVQHPVRKKTKHQK